MKKVTIRYDGRNKIIKEILSLLVKAGAEIIQLDTLDKSIEEAKAGKTKKIKDIDSFLDNCVSK